MGFEILFPYLVENRVLQSFFPLLQCLSMAEEHHQVLSPEDMEIHVERGPPMTELSDVGPSEVSRLKLALSSSETTVANLKKGMLSMLSVFLDTLVPTPGITTGEIDRINIFHFSSGLCIFKIPF